MISFIRRESEVEIIDYLTRNGYKRIISIYPSGNRIVCRFEK